MTKTTTFWAVVLFLFAPTVKAGGKETTFPSRGTRSLMRPILALAREWCVTGIDREAGLIGSTLMDPSGRVGATPSCAFVPQEQSTVVVSNGKNGGNNWPSDPKLQKSAGPHP